MADDIPDWTQAVTVSGGSVTVKGGDVNVVNTPSVTVSSGTVDVGNTPAVTISSGSVDIGAGNVDVQNAAGTVIQTGAALDFIDTALVTISGGVGTITLPEGRVLRPYAALLVQVSGGVAASAVYATAWDQSLEGLHDWAPTFGAAFGGEPGATSFRQAIIPFAAEAGDNLRCSVWATVATGTMTVRVFGLTLNPGVRLRPDGRAYPSGAKQVTGVYLSSGTTALLPALAAPLRYLLGGARVRGFATATASVTSAGFTDICSIGAPVLTDTAPIQPPGLLLGTGQAVNVTRANTHAVRATVTYDVVA